MQSSVLSSLQMKPETRKHITTTLIWAARLIVGCTFIVSGWAKAIDPWGFLIKAGEYLQTWGWTLPREFVLVGCVGLSCVEFITGILLLTGSLKRTAPILAGSMMTFMLPLTLYIAIKNPVSDCGCFGDFITISNWATFWKNVVLTALIVFLIIKNKTVSGIYHPVVQWIVVLVSALFPLSLSFAGYHIQPLVDFRPYKVGSVLAGRNQTEGYEEFYVYEKDGKETTFSLAELPDSTWTFVDVVTRDKEIDDSGFDVRRSDGSPIDLGEEYEKLLLLIVPEPDLQFLSRARFANQLNEFALGNDADMVAITGAYGATLESWVDLTRPDFPVFSADATALKQLVRGDAALVYTRNDTIEWKYNIAAVDNELFSLPDGLDGLNAVDNGKIHNIILASYVGALLLIYLLSLSPKALKLIARKKHLANP